MFDDRSQQRLGRAGETLVSNFFVRNGMLVESSIDQHDSEKDMIIGGKKAEIKTQVPFVTKDAFTFKPKQLKKCLNVDVVIFVSVPCPNTNHFSFGKVYMINPNKMDWYRRRTKGGRTMILIPINQKYMVELFEMTQEEIEKLKSYSVSEWRR